MPLDPLKYSDPIVRVYEACVDELLINLAKHFSLASIGKTGSWEYEVMMLSKLGAIRKETAEIITKRVANNEPMIVEAVKTAMLDALEEVEPDLRKAARAGLLQDAPVGVIDGIQNQLRAYSRQARNQLNLVNTVMLEGTAEAYRKGVYAAVDIVKQMESAQDILNVQTGKVITGVATPQQALRAAVKAMADNGITGFVDHAGRKWSAEAYVRMDIKTTVANAANQAVMDRNASYGNDIVWPRVNATARPGCYPWQGQLISMSNNERDVPDGNGKMRHVYPVSKTTYGQPDGIWGINCHHGPMNVFIPGLSYVRGEDVKPDQKENDRLYALTQEQRRLERRVRYAKRDAAMYRAAGDEVSAKEADRIARARNAKLKEFVKENDGLAYAPDNTWVLGSSRVKKALNKQQSHVTMEVLNNPYGFPAITWKHDIVNDVGTPDKPMCNPLFTTKKTEYTHNCQRCVQAYEFRRRGFDVVAKPKPKVRGRIRYGNDCFTGADGKMADFTFFQTESKVKKEISNAPDGARYVVYVKWKRTYGNGAHVFIAEKENGVVRYVDPQSGKVDVADYFGYGSPGRFGYFRLDDKKLTTDVSIVDEVMEARKK